MILEPAAKLAEPEEFDMSGLRLAATSPPSDHVLVTQVLGIHQQPKLAYSPATRS
jgi:hypothetical protein